MTERIGNLVAAFIVVLVVGLGAGIGLITMTGIGKAAPAPDAKVATSGDVSVLPVECTNPQPGAPLCPDGSKARMHVKTELRGALVCIDDSGWYCGEREIQPRHQLQHWSFVKPRKGDPQSWVGRR